MKEFKNYSGARHLSFIFIFLFICTFKLFAQQDSTNVIMNIPGFPQVFELNVGQKHTVRLVYKGMVISRSIKLISFKPYFEPYSLFKKGPPEIYSKAEVVLAVSGKRVILVHRPYQMPVEFNGLRLYVEAIKDWALSADIADLKGLKGQVRLSVSAAGEAWGPRNMIFPIKGYRWKAGVYQNTWSALVPYNLRYYHRGEDYGAVPDKLDIVSPFDGKIIGSPLPNGDGQSNAVYIQNKSGVIFRVAHMDIENIQNDCKIGNIVRSGEILGKTGMTWSGRKSQINDSHCHVELQYHGTQLASYPYFMEAYLRTYPDKVIAVAGGYQFTDVGMNVLLDATRSIARKGETIKSYTWKLHNGEIKNSSKVILRYQYPGLYTEQLTVKTLSGAEDRDFVQIRVFDSTVDKRDIAYGWAAYDPVRDIHPNTKVLFWNRLINTKGSVMIDFGDNSGVTTVNKEIYHIYKAEGRYVVTLFSHSNNDKPITIKMEVVVE
ncbi:MAG TPA: PKD domain-containing protein [Hanamia sp.]|nr:PKD domain-containing protein [Hanamia sp.]